MCGLHSARNAAAAHKANHTIVYLNLRGNAIGSDGALALADGMKALLMMLCFLWNMTGVLVTWMNTASLPTCSLTRKKGSAPSSQPRTSCVARNVSHRMAKRWNIRSDEVHVVCRGFVFAMLITCEP